MIDISYIALNRIVEERMAGSEEYKKEIERSGKVVLSFGREISDAELLKKLRSFNIVMDKNVFSELCKRFLSAEEMSEWLIKKQNLEFKEMEIDWIWICFTILWERWFPDRPSFEMIDDRMQEGYEKQEKKDSAGACKIWLGVWKNILNIMNSRRMRSLNEFDNLFRGTQSLFNWVQDLEMELGNAGVDEKKFFEDRILFCEEFINRFPREDPLVIENMKRAIAESYFEIGQPQKAETLFKKWLEEDPQWGWGWIGWSDNYWLYHGESKNYERAEELLREGLFVKNVRDRDELLERLESLYSETGREEEAKRIRQEIGISGHMKQSVSLEKGNILRLKKSITFDGEGLPLEEFDTLNDFLAQGADLPDVKKPKIGRNDPCPCGSGKKFKKCCGR
ncbi:MAG: SEC-C metal-binding domain-containing protein [Thermodesulfobacteriota bacterium]